MQYTLTLTHYVFLKEDGWYVREFFNESSTLHATEYGPLPDEQTARDLIKERKQMLTDAVEEMKEYMTARPSYENA